MAIFQFENFGSGVLNAEKIFNADGQDVLVVAHNAVNQSMVANALGLGSEYFRRLSQSIRLTTFVFNPYQGEEAHSGDL